MANETGKRFSVPSKIMAGLAVVTLLGLGLCGGSAMTGDKLQGYFMAAGAVCFFGGLIALILFGIGWVIVAICKQLFGKKD